MLVLVSHWEQCSTLSQKWILLRFSSYTAQLDIVSLPISPLPPPGTLPQKSKWCLAWHQWRFQLWNSPCSYIHQGSATTPLLFLIIFLKLQWDPQLYGWIYQLYSWWSHFPSWQVELLLPLRYLFVVAPLHCLCCFPMSKGLQAPSAINPLPSTCHLLLSSHYSTILLRYFLFISASLTVLHRAYLCKYIIDESVDG